MKKDFIHISEKIHFKNSLRSALSFKKFVDFLQAGIQNSQSLKAPYFRWLLKKFEKFPELSETVSFEQVGEYEDILEMISTCLLPLAADESSLWALGNALSPEIFYSTDGFHELMSYLKKPVVLNPAEGDADFESEKIIHELQYGIVLEKIYNLPYLKKTEWIRKFLDPETGLDKYFKIHIDTRFVEIRPVQPLPDFDCSTMQSSSVWGREFKKIKTLLPLNLFEARGFSIITLTDVTAEQAVEEIGKLIVNNTRADKGDLFKEISHCLQTIAGSQHYQFEIIPILAVNDRPALFYENYPVSVIVRTCWEHGISKKDFTAIRQEFIQNPRPIVWSDKNPGIDIPEILGQAFIKAGIGTYMMFPIFHNHNISGVFEVSTKKEHPMMSEAQLVKLKPALPLISQLIQNLIARFNRSIEDIIKEKFTSIQPSVQWKFNEAAWHYLRDHATDKKNRMESIEFRDLHPLYGAVDIRNSTILRNRALAKDYTVQLNLLIDAVTALDYTSFPQLERILTNTHDWLQIIRDPMTTQQEIRLNEFFEQDVRYELDHITRTSPEAEKTIQSYFLSINEQSGIAFENRRLLEMDIQQVNDAVNNFYESASAELQQIYPCYFEKFRTDGVEYDIYAGQSIAPKRPFLKENLQDMKKWQLESMVKVVQLTSRLKQNMTNPLQTTQLLFVHPQTIHITFRKDEKRFDVEGAYNIRYHIIKKRIDKVTIMDSDERLTQPDKIALVYFDERDAHEYIEYIKQMQEKNLLLKDLEELELEALQGVNGLKALRVGVRVEDLDG